MNNIHDSVYSPARHRVDLLIEALNLPQSYADDLRFKHEIDMRTDPATGAMFYENGAADTAAWLRGIEKSYPHLVGKTPAPTKPVTPAPATWSDKSLTEVFAGNARGDAAATAELNRRSRHGDGTPEPAFNLTTTMAAAKRGDPAARAALETFFKS